MTAPTVDQRPIVTFESLMQRKETNGEIVPPFTPDEVALALSIARAHYYAHTLCEDLPARAILGDNASFAWWHALNLVCKRR
jgi:hypothetical protein